jgi:hypothetical protein
VRLVDGRLIVASLLEQLQEPQVTVVLLVGGSVRGVGDVLEVVAGVRRQVPDLDLLQGVIPARGVVGATLPGVVDRDQPGPFGVPGGGEVEMPGQQARVAVAQKVPTGFDPALVLLSAG